MRILVLFNHDPGLYGILDSQPTQIVGGSFRRFIEIAKRIGKYGVDLEVIESSPTYPKSNRDLNYECHEFATPALKIATIRLTDPWLVAWEMACAGKKLVKNKHFDLILSPSEIVAGQAAFLLSHETKIPWVAVAHHLPSGVQSFMSKSESSSPTELAVGFYARLRSIPEEKTFNFIYNTASIISVSRATEKALRNHGITTDIFICGNGVDLGQIDAVHHGTCMYDGIFVGRFVQSKGILEALKVFENICNERPEAKFALVGGGVSTVIQSVKEEIMRKKLEKNVDVLGYVDDAKKFELMKSSKTFVYPSHIEGWGIVVAEALACSVPVICYDLPAFKDVFTCEAVRLCKEGNVNQMIVETKRLLDNTLERKRLGIIGRNFVERFDWEEIAKKEAQIYSLIANKHHRH